MTGSTTRRLPELETLLQTAPGVRSAAAAARDGQIVGWVVAGDLPTFSMPDVYAHIVRSASASVLPDCLLLVDELPRGRDGALDHHGLIWP